jgi:hypothetical protein
MKTFKKTFTLHDQAGLRFDITAEITTRNKYYEFTLSGTASGRGGQLQDSIKPVNENQKELLALWTKYHLQDVGNIHNFDENLIGLVERIEWDEKQATKDTAKLGLADFMAEAGIDEDMAEACKAYLEATKAADLMDFEDSYQGKFGSEEVFAKDIAEQLGAIDGKDIWPNNCIDWEQAARELMCDYCEQDGYYFRNS